MNDNFCLLQVLISSMSYNTTKVKRNQIRSHIASFCGSKSDLLPFFTLTFLSYAKTIKSRRTWVWGTPHFYFEQWLNGQTVGWKRGKGGSVPEWGRPPKRVDTSTWNWRQQKARDSFTHFFFSLQSILLFLNILLIFFFYFLL